MGSSVSCASPPKVLKRSECHSKPIRMEENTEAQPLTTAQPHPAPPLPTASVVTDPLAKSPDKIQVEDKKRVDTDKDKDAVAENHKAIHETTSIEKKVELEPMTQDELAEFKQNTFDYLRNTAEEILALESYRNEDGEYLMKIRNACLKFGQSYFALKRTDLEQIVKFRLEVAQILINTKFIDLTSEIILYTYTNGWFLEDGKKNDKKYNPMSHSLVTLLNYSDGSDDMTLAIANQPGLAEMFVTIINNAQGRHFGHKEPPLDDSEERVMKHALSIIHNMSMRETNIGRLRSLDVISALQPLLKSSNDMYAMNVLASLAGIINEKECEIIDGNKDIVLFLLDILRKGLKDKMRRCRGWSCRECGFTVRALARNDANKKLLVDLGALELLVELGRTGADNEQCESVQALWALCFDEDNRSLIAGEQGHGVVDLLVDLKHSSHDGVRKACNGALWTLRDALKNTVVERYKQLGEQLVTHQGQQSKPLAGKQKSTTGHIMISYQWADQQVLKNVRDNMKAEGYKVWMDIDQMGGSTLQAMADAVEGADVFLMCMSNKYKNSPACRAEAEYAFQTRKKIIPLKMERGYIPDGWLGFVLGAKLFYEFSPKYPFTEKVKALLRELNRVVKGDNNDSVDAAEIIQPVQAMVLNAGGPHVDVHLDSASPNNQTVARITVSTATIEKVRKWCADDVQRWIEKHDLKKCGVNKLTGGEIALLACMRVECPDFFYKCLHDMLKSKLAVSYGGWCTKYWLTAEAGPGKVLLGKLPAGDIAQNGADEGVKPEQTNAELSILHLTEVTASTSEYSSRKA